MEPQVRTRRTLSHIEEYPTPENLYKELTTSAGWPYKHNQDKFHLRDKALACILYLGDFRAIEVLPLTTNNFLMVSQRKTGKPKYVLVKAVKVGKQHGGKIKYRDARLPMMGPRKPFTDIIAQYLATLKVGDRLFPWSLKRSTAQLKSCYKLKDGTVKNRRSTTLVGTKRMWQIIHAMFPNYTQHWLRAFGYNFDYDHMKCDIMAVSDKTKADPRSLQPYLRRRYEKYSVR